jgi:hypothetical protein
MQQIATRFKSAEVTLLHPPLRRAATCRIRTTCPSSQIAELKFAESCQRQIEAAELQFAELEPKELAVPTAFSAS